MHKRRPLFRHLIALFCAAGSLYPLAASSEAAPPVLSRLIVNPADGRYTAIPDETLLHLSGNFFFDDGDDLLNKALDVKREGEALEARSRGLILIPGDEQAVIDALEELDGATTNLRAEGNMVISSDANEQVHYVAATTLRGSARFYYDPEDENRLRLAVVNALFSTGDLESHLNVAAVVQSYAGLNYQFDTPRFSNTVFAIRAKAQVINLLERRIDYDDYEEKRVYDRDADVSSYFQLNADLALHHRFRHVGLGLIVEDIYTRKMRGVSGSAYQQRSLFRVTADYRRDGGELQLSADLTPRASFAEVPSRRDINVSGAVNLSRRFALIGAYNYVDHSREKDTGSVGIRYTLAPMLRFQLALVAAGPRELGGQLSLQLPL
ncbi:hypothetical protein HCU74_18330 [Spongiibacter sp. KMU-166]|uniref:Uncharacterized protein n=1 Tax=Spongiibacter thalassae TaxID=2721624 RepID=A0ABX1GLU7_9GAMM|nr:conjugal transfer protein TraF [Spongiibacter thalassae]NKI19368.1 hypothetical protein [Spongiibacter thalassae]